MPSPHQLSSAAVAQELGQAVREARAPVALARQGGMMSMADAERPTAEALPRALQEMWLQVVHAKWSSIVIVPIDRETSAGALTGSMLELFQLLDLGTFVAIKTEGASLTEGAAHAKEIAAAVSRGARVVVTVDSPLHSPGAIPVVTACEAALVLVRLGSSRLTSARTVVELIGHERVLGCVTVEGQAGAPRAGRPAAR